LEVIVKRFSYGAALVFIVSAISSSLGIASDTGFQQPFAGSPKALRWTPTEALTPANVNEPIGQRRADRIARALGFRKKMALSEKQYLLLISGQGIGGGTPSALAAAKTIDESVNYLTNSNAQIIIRNINGVPTKINLGSYGLIVNNEGALESPGNITSPARQINAVITPPVLCPIPSSANPANLPCGYMNNWLLANGAKKSLTELYKTPFLVQAAFGSKSQEISGAAQLVPNQKLSGATATVGISMAPSIWTVNFLLIYMLNPKLAALMPAYWTPIPQIVANAITASSSGQVPYSEYQAYLTN